MQLHIYKTTTTPDGRIVGTPDIEVIYNLENIHVSSMLCNKMLALFSKKDIETITTTVFNVFTVLNTSGALKNKEFDPMQLLAAENVSAVQEITETLLSVIYDNFGKAITAVQYTLDENKIYLTKEQVGTLPPAEMLAVFLLVFRKALPILRTVKRT